MPAFHDLPVDALDQITPDAYTITFAVPKELAGEYAYRPGQHLTIRTFFDDIEERRSYSICTPPDSGVLQIGVKIIPGGRFSAHVRDQLSVGDSLSVMTPVGRFGRRKTGQDGSSYVAVVAGSGITPMMSIMPAILAAEPKSSFSLVYGNRTAGSVMFTDEIADLKDRYPSRFRIFHVLSREEHEAPLLSGRIDATKLKLLLEIHPPDLIDDWFLCGPLGLIEQTRHALDERKVANRQIHTELFHTGDEKVPVQRSVESSSSASQVSARLDGRTTTFDMPASGSILEAVLAQRPDAPFACKGGVCGTCRVKLVEGEVEMERNYALDPVDLDAGFRLACQSVPVTPKVVIDFDA